MQTVYIIKIRKAGGESFYGKLILTPKTEDRKYLVEQNSLRRDTMQRQKMAQAADAGTRPRRTPSRRNSFWGSRYRTKLTGEKIRQWLARALKTSTAILKARDAS